MPFIPHTEQEVRDMLAAVDAAGVEDLYDEIPAELRSSLKQVPAGLAEGRPIVQRLEGWWQRIRGFLLSAPEEEV